MDDVKLSDFELGPVLGQGGMATVYRATFKPTGEQVALKLMLTNVADDPTFIERFRREARSTMSLHHENICRVLAAGESDGKLFMAMEILDGGSVRDLKQSFGGRLPAQLAAELVGQLLSALSAAHAQGVIHRDLKPANLMLTTAGKLKLVDFGIAKTNKEATLTATDMLLGTPAFMSPEQVRGEPLDGRSDLFSAGLILHDLLCGRSPFYSDNPATSLMKVLQEEVPSTFDVVFGLDPVLEAFHSKLTAKDRDLRFRDAAMALRALSPFLEPVRARRGRLIADAIADPITVNQTLLREQATTELERGRRLAGKHGPIHAAALAFDNAARIDPSFDEPRAELATLAPQIGFRVEPVHDPRIDEAMAAWKQQPTNAGVLKRLADLHRAAGDIREYARWTKRYLRQKDDVAALQQLTVLLWGPGSDPSLVTSTIQKLRTQDIIQGVKTGGMPAIKPDKPRTDGTTTGATAGRHDVDAEKKAAIAEAARAAAARRAAGGAVGALGTSSHESAEFGATLGSQGLFTTLREQLGAWWWVFIGGSVVAGIVFVAARGVVAGVNVAQDGLKKHDEGQLIAEENATFDMQRTKLNEATAALARGSFVACSLAAQQSLAGETTAKLVLDAKWLVAQCSLLARDAPSAQDALQDFKDNANISDRRYEIAKTQLKALARGEVPGGLRSW
jgi:tRNA A-37 threonylcarbamoyl transferase component Bud32